MMDTYYNCMNSRGSAPTNYPALPDDDGNISCDPNFAYDHGEYGYYHLDPSSACIDKGTPNEPYTGEEDIDTDTRVYNSRVDMGADEADCGDVSNELDWNADGVVNNLEFAMFADVWLAHDPNDPEYTPDPEEYAIWTKARRCNFDDDYDIDIDDLAVFCAEWRWVACWRSSQEEIWMMMGGGGYGMESVAVGPAIGAAKAVVPEPTLEEQIDSGKELIEWLEEIRQDKEVQEAIDEKKWEEFLEEIYRWLDGLEGLL